MSVSAIRHNPPQQVPRHHSRFKQANAHACHNEVLGLLKLIPITIQMKGTEVPNPQRSGACDCTCAFIRNRTLSRDSLMLACALFCSYHCKVRSRVSDALSQALCNLSSAFLADFTLSDSTATIRFINFLSQITLCFSFGSKDKSQRSHVFRLTGTAALHCGHTLCWRDTYCHGQKLNSQRTSLPEQNGR